jgi:16S rRNA (cytidine1402-2'-O)-methyltransferase
MPGTLFVVATPIGNLEDITLRALRVLREADVIAAEDTRRTAKLLAHHAISTPTLSFHEHNTRTRLPQIIARLERGQNVALVTDAGTPGVSDPGVELVAAAVERGIPIDPIPGASAPLVAGIASGFPLEPMTILGFPPSRAKDRSLWLQQASELKNTFTFFEAPHRIRQTLLAAQLYLVDRPIMVGRELTKRHQEFIRGDIASVIGQLPEPRGEFTVIVGPAPAAVPVVNDATDETVVAEFWRLTESAAGSRRETVSAVAKKYDRSARDVYALIERSKKLGV